MSLSDGKNSDFKPLDLDNLESFKDEQFSKEKTSEPDFGLFKSLIDFSQLKPKESDSFKALFDDEEEEEEKVFEELFEENRKNRRPSLLPPDPEPAPDPEEIRRLQEEEARRQEYEARLKQGYEEGFQSGEKAGMEKGFLEGRKEGLEKGEEEGLKQGEEKGFETGYQNGEQKALEEMHQQSEDILASLQDMLGTVENVLDELVDAHEEQLVGLVCKIAERVVLAKVSLDDELAGRTVMDALKSLARPEEVVLNVSPDDYEYIEMVKDDFFDAVESLKKVSVRQDASVKKGGCKIQTSTARLSTDPETKLKEIFDAIASSGEADETLAGH